MTKKLLVLVLVIIMTLGIFGLMGCENAGNEIEVDGWTLFQFGSGSNKKGQVNILSADESLVVDGILHVPAKIGIYDIYGFGTLGKMFAPESYFTISSNVERIVLSAELHVGDLFWGNSGYFDTIMTEGSSVKYVEFCSETFERVNSFWSNRELIIIIPDGSTQSLIARLEALYPSQSPDFERFDFIEKSNIEAKGA